MMRDDRSNPISEESMPDEKLDDLWIDIGGEG